MALSSLELTDTFFHDLKQFNATNFKTIERATLDHDDATVHKAFSSVVTRYFIFSERHPEICSEDKRVLYFKLKIDMIAQYFSEYPDVNLDLLKPFQIEMKKYVQAVRARSHAPKPSKGLSDDSEPESSEISDIKPESAATLQV